jgi:DNA-binding NtrC family response regulator
VAAGGALLAFDWPGNVRELESAILRALHVARNGTIEVEDLGLPGRRGPESLPPVLSGAPRSYKAQKRQLLDAFDRQYLIRLMTDHRGNVSQAAQAAGKERRDLGKLLKRHSLDRRQFAA